LRRRFKFRRRREALVPFSSFQGAKSVNDRAFNPYLDRVCPFPVARGNHIVVGWAGFDLIQRRGYAGAAFKSVFTKLKRR
jgi:hypothetical protein